MLQLFYTGSGMIAFLFWAGLFLLAYSYLGYGLVLAVGQSIKGYAKKRFANTAEVPAITLVVPCYNEAAVLPEKIQNALALNYPAGKVTLLFVADGSDDNSLEILKSYPGIQYLYKKERGGKAAALNRAMAAVITPVVVFSDANSMLNRDALLDITKHFEDIETGGVAGEKKIASGYNGVGRAEGLYWQYEGIMKKLDARFGTVMGAAGELFAMRTALYPVLHEALILDDFYLSIHICLQGYKVAYEPAAYAEEKPTLSLGEEKKRKVRIAAGAFQAIGLLPLHKLWYHPKLLFQYISRRWLRWVVCPLAIPLVLAANIWLAQQGTGSVYAILLFLQGLFYAAAVVGGLLIKWKRNQAWATVPFYFLFMNYCMLAGMLLYVAGRHTAYWQKAERQL